MMDEKEDLEQKKAKYARLKAVTDEPGWVEITSILEANYHAALDILKMPGKPEDEWEARGVIKFIDDFMGDIQSEIDFGKTAQERYVKKYVKTNSQEG